MNIVIWIFICYYLVAFVFTFRDGFGEFIDLLKDAFRFSDYLVFNILIGTILSILSSLVLLIVVPAYPIVSLIRIKSIITKKRKLKESKNKTRKLERKREEIKKKYSGFERSSRSTIIKIKRKPKEKGVFPFDIQTNQVVYIEDEYNTNINKYILENLEKIKYWFNNYSRDGSSYEFIYLPHYDIAESKQDMLSEFLKYNLPKVSESSIESMNIDFGKLVTKDITHFLFSVLDYEGDRFPGLFRIKNKESIHYKDVHCDYFHLPEESIMYIEKAFYYYLDHLGERKDCIWYQLPLESDFIRLGNTYELSDYKFDYEAHKIASEIEEKINSLKAKGIEQFILNSIFSQMQGYELVKKPEYTEDAISNRILSRLKIDNDFRIYMVDYNNLEIHLTPLPKTIFFLFLRHEEGILFKHLIDHREELMEIYKSLSYREHVNNIEQSILDVIDPTSNSINEKASRIKEAFIRRFSDNIAKNYYLTGARGHEKRISLPRDYVIWESKEFDWPYKKSKSIEQSKKDDERIDHLYNQCIELMKRKEYENAIGLFTEIILLNPFHYKAYSNRAICYFQIRRYIEAENDNNVAIDLNKKSDVAFHNRGEARLMLQKYDEALEDINYFLKHTDNKCNESYFLRGLIYMEKGQIDAARQDWFTAKKLDHPDASNYLKEYPGKSVRKTKLEKSEATIDIL